MSEPESVPLPNSPALSRLDIEFDSGINTSTAWTVSLTHPSEHTPKTDLVSSLSDEGRDYVDADEHIDSGDQEPERSARALYAFEGKPEFRELTAVEAGDELRVVRENVGEGWSLVRLIGGVAEAEREHAGEVGLLPRSYYIFTTDFTPADGLEIPYAHARTRSKREASDSSITPRGSPIPPTTPLVPQSTGEWFPSFRRSLLGGRSLNRFSSFVTTGAEEWVLQGSAEEELEPSTSHGRSASTVSDILDISEYRNSVGPTMAKETEQHYVDSGPVWKTKVPSFRVLVHSPSKRNSLMSGAYTVYTITSLFDALPHSNDNAPSSPTRITVQRRFSHFVVLHTALMRRLPGIALPPLPEKQYAGRFNDDFVEARRGDLERYLSRVVRHPVARYAEVLTFFLGCENDLEFKRQLPRYLSLPAKGPAFYAHVYHPEFNFDSDDAADVADKFVSHTKAVGKGVQGLRNIFGKVREARLEMSKAERLLSYAILSMITSRPLASAPTTGISVNEEDEDDLDRTNGHMNSDGAWCWREDCEECLRLTKAMQKTSETLQSIADLHDDHARRTQLATHEALKTVAHPYTMYHAVADTHKSTLSRYQHLVQEGSSANDEVAARCETVLNTTLAEMDTYHTQKVEDFRSITREHLDGEIAFYEQVLRRLRDARSAFDPPRYEELGKSPRQPSIYERELENPRLGAKPLAQPCPHVFDSAPMRPVSVAIQEGVGMLLGTGEVKRGSVFGRFW